MATIIQLRRDTAANWTANNPILADGEPALETDSGKEKIGDGVTAWNSLDYKKVFAKSETGTVLNLSRTSGTNYNYGAASAATTYTTTSPIINGYASALINAATEPTVTGATKIAGATFVENTNMEMVVESKDGVNARYFFLEL